VFSSFFTVWNSLSIDLSLTLIRTSSWFYLWLQLGAFSIYSVQYILLSLLFAVDPSAPLENHRSPRRCQANSPVTTCTTYFILAARPPKAAPLSQLPTSSCSLTTYIYTSLVRRKGKESCSSTIHTISTNPFSSFPRPFSFLQRSSISDFHNRVVDGDSRCETAANAENCLL